MKIAITVWGKRISPVFDAARTLVIAGIEKGVVVTCEQVRLRPGCIREVVRLLSGSGVEVIICGAISHDMAEQIESGGIRLIPFIAGKVDPILEWYAKGLSIAGYQLPGCGCRGNGRGRGRKCGGGLEFESDLRADSHSKKDWRNKVCLDLTDLDQKAGAREPVAEEAPADRKTPPEIQ
jgi:predicted Fe-Mo cluster-binding NifX family protein